MARQTSFGDTLRMARERKGLDLSTVARKLRIRPDILRAIEDGDFARMPPRGYTGNMVSAYARLVGLNPSEVARAYRDEASRFETGRRSLDGRSAGSRSGERSYGSGLDRSDRRPEGGESRSSRSSRSSRGTDRARRNAAPQPQYTNLVQGRQAPGLAANFSSFLPLLVVGAIILGLLVLVLVLAFGGGRTAPAEDTPSIPISGMPNPNGSSTSGTAGDTGDASGEVSGVTPVAPTSASFSYKVADGKTAYIEVILDGKTEEAGNVTGPASKEYDVTGTLRFVLSGEPEDVEIAVDGETVEPTESSSTRGVYTYTVDYEEFLEAWQRENGVKTDDGESSGDSSGSGNADDASSSDASDEKSSDNDTE